MSQFIQVGVTAMRDPLTGEPLEQVPLYVETGNADQLPEVDVKQIARAFLKKFRAEQEVKGA